jgi:hypothetical protein
MRLVSPNTECPGHALAGAIPFFTYSSVFTLLTVLTGEVLSRQCAAQATRLIGLNWQHKNSLRAE